MIITKYPDWVEDQLKILDDRIAAIYREFSEMKVRPDEVLRLKRNLYEAIKPYVDEKVRLISNSVPTYIFKGDEYGIKIVNKGKCMMCGKELTEDDDIFFCKECEKKNWQKQCEANFKTQEK